MTAERFYRESPEVTTRTVAVVGCDDLTSIEVTATSDQWALIDKLAKAITAEGGGCKPTMDADYVYADISPHLDLTVVRHGE